MSDLATVKDKATELAALGSTFWSGLAFFLLVIVALAVGSWKLFVNMMDSQVAPIVKVVIDGEMPYTTKADIAGVVDQQLLQNFFQLDVNRVQQVVEALPWVATASVRKQWPNQLNLYVVDHQPEAIWNQTQLLNTQGQVFEASLTRLKQTLPHFNAPTGAESLALENYRNLNRLLSYSQLTISRIELSPRHAWTLELSNGTRLNLGREERVERVQRFIDFYPQLEQVKGDQRQIDYVDLRYDTGFAVGWKTLAEKRV